MSSNSEAGPSRDSIPLYLINGVGTIWDAQVAATLHCEHGISGLRAGTLPGVSQQNAFLGLPMTLMREETAYLVTSGICHLVPVSSTPKRLSPEEIESHTQARIARIRAAEEARDRDIRSKAELSRSAFEKGGEKARLKREARARAKAEKTGGTDQNEDNLFGDDNTPLPPPTPSKTKDGDIKAVTPISTGSASSNPGYFHVVSPLPTFPEYTYESPITALPHPLFPFPTTPRDHALLGTFKTLSTKGYRMGLGPRFGGEYLIYPGDYLRYHAHFTSQVLVRDEYIKPREVVAWGRLGTGTKKAGLLCCWDDSGRGEEDGIKEGQVEFYSLEWANFG